MTCCTKVEQFLSEISDRYSDLLEESKKQIGSYSWNIMVKIACTKLRMAISDLELALMREGLKIESLSSDHSYALFLDIREIMSYEGSLSEEQVEECVRKLHALDCS